MAIHRREVCRINPHRASCCADITGPNRPDTGAPCPRPVTYAGLITTHIRGRAAPQTIWAFSCRLHHHLLTDARPYGTMTEHRIEMMRRRRRDAWAQHSPPRSGDPG